MTIDWFLSKGSKFYFGLQVPTSLSQMIWHQKKKREISHIIHEKMVEIQKQIQVRILIKNWEMWLSTWEPLITWRVISHVFVTLNAHLLTLLVLPMVVTHFHKHRNVVVVGETVPLDGVFVLKLNCMLVSVSNLLIFQKKYSLMWFMCCRTFLGGPCWRQWRVWLGLLSYWCFLCTSKQG